jgi:hypothetical protein
MSTKNLTEADMFYIQQHVNSNIDELVLAVRKGKEQVQEYVQQVKSGQVKVLESNHSNSAGIVNKTANKRPGVAVMTQQGSELGDEAKKTTVNRRNNPDCVFPCKTGEKK